MITILTNLWPFTPTSVVRQRNALASWRAMCVDAQIITYQRVAGDSTILHDYGIEVASGLPPSVDGLPRVDAIFAIAQAKGKYERQVWVNADIILMEDFLDTFLSLRLSHFVMIGQRTDVNLDTPLSFSGSVDSTAVRRRLSSAGRLHNIGGISYFAYTRGSMPPLPPLYLAAAWDNLVLYECRKAGIPVIDATLDVQAFHQDHEYATTPEGGRLVYEGAAARANVAQSRDRDELFYVTDASHWLYRGKVRNSLCSPKHASRQILTYPLLRRWATPFRWPLRATASLVRRLGSFWMSLCWDAERRRAARLR